jgi:hypothetical protein
MENRPWLALAFGIVVGVAFLLLSIRFFLLRDLTMALLTGIAAVAVVTLKIMDYVALRRKQNDSTGGGDHD